MTSETAAPRHSPIPLVVMTDRFPELSETFIATEVVALARIGHRLRVEALARPSPERLGESFGIAVDYAGEESRCHRLLYLTWLVARHPLGVLRDLAARPRWRRSEPVRSLRALAPCARRLHQRGERHIHVHFAATAALDALRLARLLGVTYSVTAHAYEIFAEPANLREKLTGAAFSTTGCSYNVRHLQSLLDPPSASSVHEIVMGVDCARFRRRTPYGRDGQIVAVGRLVEKKGFRHLIEAVAHLHGGRVRLGPVTIVGAGPLHDSLRQLARRLGVEDTVRLVGPRPSDAVRELLEDADLFALPCVVAPDGDRDSMPVAAKEALAMEVPVVATEEVGLPELIGPRWGRLVPPHDAAALATAIEELLSLPPGERAAMGRAGRAHVLEIADPAREACKLARLLDGRT